MSDDLYVLTMLANPLRWRSRVLNYRAFEREVRAAGARLYTAEVAFGDRKHVVTHPLRLRRHLRLRSDQELWQKEAALNALLRRLPKRAKYVAWVDADVAFARPDWVRETVEQLQHHKVVQLFSHALDLGPSFEPLADPAHGFAYSYLNGFPRLPSPGPLPTNYAEAKAKGVYWHPGFAWAARRDVLDAMGGLVDIGILGAGDWYMANAFIGDVERSLSPVFHENYKRVIRDWAARAAEVVGKDVGYVEGLLLHHIHGKKSDRQYQKRTPVLSASMFDPDLDLAREKSGLWRLRHGNTELRDMIRAINRARREDG